MQKFFIVEKYACSRLQSVAASVFGTGRTFNNVRSKKKRKKKAIH